MENPQSFTRQESQLWFLSINTEEWGWMMKTSFYNLGLEKKKQKKTPTKQKCLSGISIKKQKQKKNYKVP